jgi:hypothetical protein
MADKSAIAALEGLLKDEAFAGAGRQTTLKLAIEKLGGSPAATKPEPKPEPKAKPAAKPEKPEADKKPEPA